MLRPSMLGELLKLVPRDLVTSAVRRHGSDKWRKNFKTWDHLVAMLASQLAGASSLRDVELLFSHNRSRGYHLNCQRVSRSTLSDANRDRDADVFATIVHGLIAGSSRKLGKTKGLLALLDSTPVQLIGRGLEWAAASRVRSSNQGLKLHVLVAGGDGLEAGRLDHVQVTDMNVNDITAAADVRLEAGRIYVFDKGYCDYNWWHAILENGAHFVTRLKKNAAYRVVEERSCDSPHIIADKVIELTNRAPRGGKTNRLAGHPLRLVSVPHPGGKPEPLLIVSDRVDASAQDIADCYRQRWDIEILFRWIKQNLKIKRFIGTSRNAILTQIYCALIAYLVVRQYARLVDRANIWRMKDLLTICRNGLFHPAKPPDKPPKRNQPQTPPIQHCLPI